MNALEPYEFTGTDRFEVRGRLGSGTSGSVYEVRDHKLDSVIALKTLHKADPAAIHRFKKEFRSLSVVNHPNLVQLYELESDADRWFFTMELIEGFDFLEYIRQGLVDGARQTQRLGPDGSVAERADLDLLRDALRQLAEGLQALHNAGMLHRDLKPSNIRVSPEGRLVLLDFGLVKDLFGGGVFETLEGGEISGTPAYMAPEQAAGLQVTPASDWYSVGAILYESLTGQIPFSGSFLKILTDKQKEDPRHPSEIASDLPGDLVDLAMELQHREPERRPSGEEVLRRLGSDTKKPVARETLGTSSSLGAPFVGREAHLELLQEAFEESRQGRTAVVWVQGSSGMGSSALVRRFLNLIRHTHEDAVPLSGRCYERESVPYKALDEVVDALSRYLRQLPDQEVEVLMPSNVLALARLFPALRRVQAVAGAHRRVLDVPDSHEQRRRAFTALRELFDRLAQRKPLVLFIDDLQWGDLDSAALLTEILRPPDPPPLLLVSCFRSEERETSPLLQTLLKTDFGGAAMMRELLLEELAPAEARQLVLEHLGDDSGIAQTLADTIARESGGSPFFIDELVRSARAETGLARGAGISPEMVQAIESRMSVERMIQTRLESIAPEARRLLQVVAVAGRPVDLEAARQAAELGPETQAALAALRVQSLARIRRSRDRDEIEAYHDRINEAVLKGLVEEKRERLHHRLALALEGTGRADPESLAHHFHEAGQVDLAAKFATEAADQAKDALAFDRAARLYRIALGLGVYHGEDERLLHVKLGEALSNAGRGAKAARELLLGAEGAKAAEALELRRRAAEQLLISGHIDEGIEAVRQVLASIGMKLADNPGQALRSIVKHTLQLKFRGLKFGERDSSQISAEDLIKVDTCWSVAIGLGTVDTIRGMDFQKRHVLLALKIGEPYRVARALAIEAAYSSSRGHKKSRQTADLIRESMTLAERVGHPHALGLSNMTAGMAAYLEGQWKRALELLDRSEAILRDNCTGVTWELDTAMSFQIRALLFIGDVREIRSRLPRALKDVREKGDLYAEVNLRSRSSWFVYLADDRPDAALAEVNDAIQRWTQRGFHIQHYWHLTGLVECALYRGDAEAAWEALEAAWPKIEKSLLLRIQLTRTEGFHLRCRGALAAAAAAGIDSPNGQKLLKLLNGNLKKIEKEKISWANPLAELIRAGIATLRGDQGAAVELLVSAAAGFDAADMELYAAVARRRRGQLLSGQGHRLVAEAEEWIRGHGVVDVARMSGVLAPGRWS